MEPDLITVIEVGITDFSLGWNEFQGSMFTNPAWVKSMGNQFCTPIYLNFMVLGHVVAKLCGLVIDGNLLQGRQLYFYSSPLFKDFSEERYNRCMEALLVFAKQKRYTRVNMKPWDQTPSCHASVKCLNTSSTREFVIDLLCDDPQKSVSSRIMKNVKKGVKASATIQESTREADLDLLLSFLDSTKSRRFVKFGRIYSPFYMFNLNRQTILNLMENGAAKLICANIGDKTHSILLLVYGQDKVCCVLKGSDSEAYCNGLSSFVDVETIKLLKSQGYKCLNLGPELITAEGDGLNQYKQGIGAVHVERFGNYSFYLIYPYRFLNTLMLVGRQMAKIRLMENWAKRMSKAFAGASN